MEAGRGLSGHGCEVQKHLGSPQTPGHPWVHLSSGKPRQDGRPLPPTARGPLFLRHRPDQHPRLALADLAGTHLSLPVSKVLGLGVGEGKDTELRRRAVTALGLGLLRDVSPSLGGLQEGGRPSRLGTVLGSVCLVYR